MADKFAIVIDKERGEIAASKGMTKAEAKAYLKRYDFGPKAYIAPLSEAERINKAATKGNPLGVQLPKESDKVRTRSGKIGVVTRIVSGRNDDPDEDTYMVDLGDGVGYGYSEYELTVVKGNPLHTVNRPGLVITGNPDEVPLKDAFAAMAEFMDYEAAVVEAAANEIDDPSIAAAAHDQAAAMETAADALLDAAEAANETAGEVFVETGIAAVDSEDELIAGNANPPPAGETIMGNPITGQDAPPGMSAVVPAHRNPPNPLPSNQTQSPGVRSGTGPAHKQPLPNVDNPIGDAGSSPDTPPTRMHFYKRPAKEWMKGRK